VCELIKLHATKDDYCLFMKEEPYCKQTYGDYCIKHSLVNCKEWQVVNESQRNVHVYAW